MKKKYICTQCGKENEFDTKDIIRYVERLAESEKGTQKQDNRIAYVVECKYCHAYNSMKL